MRYFRNILFALAAFLWLPASAHCQLEALSGLAFLQCPSESQSAHGDCDGSGCCAAEKSHYKHEQPRLAIPTLDLLSLSSAPVVPMTRSLPTEVCLGILTAAPPDLLSSRHFLSRTALPVRAPSLAS